MQLVLCVTYHFLQFLSGQGNKNFLIYEIMTKAQSISGVTGIL